MIQWNVPNYSLKHKWILLTLEGTIVNTKTLPSFTGSKETLGEFSTIVRYTILIVSLN